MDITARLDAVTNRLVDKIGMSQTPVPGFMIGLSGTDSIVAFTVLASALARARGKFGTPFRLVGIHYVSAGRRPGRFQDLVIPWLAERHPEAELIVTEPLGGNQDQQRWADLQLRSVNEVRRTEDGVRITALDESERYWVAGTINATEHALGKHSVLANAVSMQPIRSLWKTDVMRACEMLEVPQEIIDDARLPDCLCGRDEIAAQHIELIDDILRYRFDPRDHDPELMITLMGWISDRKREGGFRQRIPYIV
jgi:NH3-dependent NAD+ synthetase